MGSSGTKQEKEEIITKDIITKKPINKNSKKKNKKSLTEGKDIISAKGKGIEYYKNGNKRYEGDFVNNKYEGNGTYYKENGPIILANLKMGILMVKALYTIKMVKQDLMVLLLMVDMKEPENYIMMMMKIILQLLENIKMDFLMEKLKLIIKMEIYYMMEIGLMVKSKDMANYFLKMVI